MRMICFLLAFSVYNCDAMNSEIIGRPNLESNNQTFYPVKEQRECIEFIEEAKSKLNESTLDIVNVLSTCVEHVKKALKSIDGGYYVESKTAAKITYKQALAEVCNSERIKKLRTQTDSVTEKLIKDLRQLGIIH